MVRGVIRRRQAGFMRWQRIAVGVSAVAALVNMAACSSTNGSAVLPPAGRDITTASDETPARKRGQIRLELASGYFSQGKLTTALDELKQSISVDPTNPDAFSLRGVIYDALGDDALAEDSFKRALAMQRSHAGALQNYGWFLCKRKRFDEAEQWLAMASELAQNPTRDQALLVRGVCLTRSGKLEKAQTVMQRAYELDPANPAIGVNLANVLYRRGDYERARFYIRRVNAKEEFTNAETLWLAIRIERRLRNINNEAELSSQLRSRYPQSPEASALNAGRYEE